MKLDIEKIDVNKLKEIISYYKDNIKEISLDEIYKIEAITIFQENWDINSNDFYKMLSNSLSKTKNLLASRNYFPKNMILYFSQKDYEIVRDMFVNLFNETISLSRRVSYFKDRSDILLKQYGNEKMTSHYQHLNAISTYLFLRFPQKYYIYKEGKFKLFSKKIGYNSLPKRGSFEILEAYYEVCDYIFNFIKEDKKLIEIAKTRFKGLNLVDDGLHLVVEEIIYLGSKLNLDKNYNFNNDEIKDKHNKENKFINEKSSQIIKKENKYNAYTKQDFLQEVFMDEKDYDFLVSLLNRKKNIILQGAPGVGKTFLSKKLAYSILNKKDNDKIKFVQFHQSYSYEDFIMGYKPSKDGFELKYGAFYKFCKKAEKDSKNKYFFIIDEINRGNVSKIFGELMMLIEKDYRNVKINLAYADEEFSVPKNIYIIGIMNTADRSIAMIDYALRRRFGFFNLKPAFENDKFINYIKSLNNKAIVNLVEQLKLLNKDIQDDFSLGEGFCIGHSYLLIDEISQDRKNIDIYIKEIIEFEIIPLIKEYWFDDYDKLTKWEKILRNLLN